MYASMYPLEETYNLILNPIEKPTSFHADIDSIKPLRAKRLVFIGRFATVKNPKLFISICAKFLIPGLMIGDGPLRNECLRYNESTGANVSFMGFLDNPWTLVEEGDLLLIPSVMEGDGRVLAEAMVRNIPVLVSDIPSFREYCLPTVCYVSDFSSIDNSVFENIGIFQCGIEKTELIVKVRDPENILRDWESLIQQHLKDK